MKIPAPFIPPQNLAAQNLAVVPSRSLPVAPASPILPAAPTTALAPPVTTGADRILDTLLASGRPELRNAQGGANVARLYAESAGTPATVMPPPQSPTSPLASTDARLLAELSNRGRAADPTPTGPAAPSSRSDVPPLPSAAPSNAIVLDGRMIPLTLAQAAALRVALSAPRRLGAGAGTSEIEAPAASSAAPSADDEHPLIKSVSETERDTIGVRDEHSSHHDVLLAPHRAADGRAEPPLGPVPQPVAYQVQGESLAASLATVSISFAPDVTPSDVSVALDGETGSYHITLSGAQGVIVVPTGGGVVRLVFADATVRHL